MSTILLVVALVCFLCSVVFGDAVVLEQNIQALDWVALGLAAWVASGLVELAPRRGA